MSVLERRDLYTVQPDHACSGVPEGEHEGANDGEGCPLRSQGWIRNGDEDDEGQHAKGLNDGACEHNLPSTKLLIREHKRNGAEKEPGGHDTSQEGDQTAAQAQASQDDRQVVHNEIYPGPLPNVIQKHMESLM